MSKAFSITFVPRSPVKARIFGGEMRLIYGDKHQVLWPFWSSSSWCAQIIVEPSEQMWKLENKNESCEVEQQNKNLIKNTMIHIVILKKNQWINTSVYCSYLSLEEENSSNIMRTIFCFDESLMHTVVLVARIFHHYLKKHKKKTLQMTNASCIVSNKMTNNNNDKIWFCFGVKTWKWQQQHPLHWSTAVCDVSWLRIFIYCTLFAGRWRRLFSNLTRSRPHQQQHLQ